MFFLQQNILRVSTAVQLNLILLVFFENFPQNTFYSASLCISAVLLLAGVRLSVCLSIILMYCIQTAKDIVKFLSRPDSPITVVFLTQASLSNIKGNPFSGGV